MNKMLVVVFDGERAVDAGSHAMRKLHDEGDITLYAMSVIARNEEGKVRVEKAGDRLPSGAGMGLAVGALVGLMGGPVALAVGAVTDTLAGMLSDFWVAGVDVEFVETAAKMLAPGKVALVAEVDEEWVAPVDQALEASGGTVLRRARSEAIDAQFDHRIAACKGEIEELEAEAIHTTGAAESKLRTQVASARASLAHLVQQVKRRVGTLEREADGKAAALKGQLGHAKGEARGTLEDRIQRVKSGYHARGARLSQAWALKKEALAV